MHTFVLFENLWAAPQKGITFFGADKDEMHKIGSFFGIWPASCVEKLVLN
jgi:hypothetical protein